MARTAGHEELRDRIHRRLIAGLPPLVLHNLGRRGASRPGVSSFLLIALELPECRKLSS